MKFARFGFLISAFIGAALLVSCGGDSNPSVPNPTMAFHARGAVKVAAAPRAVTGTATGNFGEFTPADLYRQYGFPVNGNGGAGTTIAIVDAPGSSTIAADLAAFSTLYGLPQLANCSSTTAGLSAACAASSNPFFTTIDLSGGKTDPGWAGEISLDVQWSHAFAPKANIILVIANSSSLNDLDAAVRLAASQPNVVAVSMSYGGNEFDGEDYFDSTFRDGIANNGIVFLASTGDAGDWGSNKSYPAASPYVTAVGGTAITPSGEMGWSMGGGGPAIYQRMPSYQTKYLTSAPRAQGGNLALSNANNFKGVGAGISGNLRAMPDVSLNADPNNSPVIIVVGGQYSYIGGTSESSPLWAGVVAQLASQTGVNAFKTRIKSAADGYGFNSLLYSASMVAAGFSDITMGSNDTTGVANGCPIFCAATVGYDTVTGLGVPKVSAFLSAYK
jgi:subtilase family serine protease